MNHAIICNLKLVKYTKDKGKCSAACPGKEIWQVCFVLVTNRWLNGQNNSVDGGISLKLNLRRLF
jgi:hypothetical protein